MTEPVADPVGVKVGVSLIPERTSLAALRAAWRAADDLGVDSIWIWDHFFPLAGPGSGASLECWTTIAALAADTRRATVGSLVTACGYRNPDLLADIARTVDHVSGGRCVLGVGSGWFEPDYTEYGFSFGTAASRLRDLAAALPRIRARLDRLDPPPIGRVPILIGGGGERVTLRLVAEYADAWNLTPSAADTALEEFGQKSAVLDTWAVRLGRDPGSIERTMSVFAEHPLLPLAAYRAAGVEHVIRSVRDPFDLADVAALLDQRD